MSCIIILLYDLYFIFYWFFFFKQKTAYEMRISDWISDVCSSDLEDRHEQRIIFLGGADFLRHFGPHHRERVAIDIVDDGGERDQRDHAPAEAAFDIDRKRVVEGKSVSVRGDLVGRSMIKKKKSSESKQHIYINN